MDDWDQSNLVVTSQPLCRFSSHLYSDIR